MSRPMLAQQGEVENLPIMYCEPHPDFFFRFKYDIDSLAESISVNGQLNPGYAVQKPDGTGYLVFIGVRRLLACKTSFELHRRPNTYRAFVSEKMSEKEMHMLAMAENEGEKGQRQDLTVAEEIAYYGSLRFRFKEEEILEIGTKAGKDRAAVRAMLGLARSLDGVLEGICSIEKKADFRFKLPHYEALSRIDDRRLLFQVAAVAATARRPPDKVDLQAAPALAKGIDWLARLFPNTAPQSPPAGATAWQDPRRHNESRLSSNGTMKPRDHATIIMPRVFFVACRKCGAQKPFTIKVRAQVSSFALGEDGRQRGSSSVPDALYICEFVCDRCGNEFWVNVAETELGVAADTHESRTTETPTTVLEEASLMFDWKVTGPDGTAGAWIVVRGGSRFFYRDGRMDPAS